MTAAQKRLAVKELYRSILGRNRYSQNFRNYNSELLDYSGEIYENGWLRVIYKKQDAWVSGKYGQLVD